MTETKDFSELLTDRDRILMAAWTLPNKGPLTDGQRRQALDNFAQYVQRQSLSFGQVAKQVGTPRTSTIRELLKGTFREHADDHVRTLNNWVEQDARRRAVKLQGAFVETAVAKRILGVARLVRENQTMGLAIGPTGIGKTRCAQAIHETYVGSMLITIMTGSRHPKGLTALFAQQLGVRTAKASTSDHAHLSQLERVVTRLKGSNRLLIVDEAHKLRDEAIELLREIHDAAGVPVLMFATKDLHERIQKDADPDHGQLYSRIDVIQHLTEGRDAYAGDKKPLYTIQEIKELFEQTPVRLSRDAGEYLRGVANQLGLGSLRKCQRLLVNAVRRARKRQNVDEHKSVTVTAADLQYVEQRLRQSDAERELIRERCQLAGAASA